MTELVDKLNRGGTTQPEADSATKSAGNGGENQPTRRDERIRQLSAEKNQWMQRYDQQQNELSGMKEKLAEMEGRLQSRGSPGDDEQTPSSWQDMTESQLADAFQLAREQNNSIAEFNALREVARRDAQGVSRSTLEQGRNSMRLEDHTRQITNSIFENFGTEAQNRDSDLYQRALQYSSAMQNQYGKDVFERVPWLGRTAYLEAQREQWTKDKDRLQDLERQVEQMKAQQGMPTGERRAASLADEARQSMESGKPVRETLRKLGIVKSLGGSE